MIKCGTCNSGVVADEKFKKLKAGGVNRHVYYRCCRSKDRDCRNPAINETDLISAFQDMAGTIELNEVQLSEKLNLEVKKFKKLQAMFLGKENTTKVQKVDLQHYSKFILKEGSVLEKRSVLECLKSNLILENKRVLFNKS